MFGKRIAVLTLAGALVAMPALSGCIGESTARMEEYKETGIAQMEEGDYEGAVESFQAGLDQSVGTIDAEEIDLSYYKALALYLSGDPDAAIEVYTSLIEFDDTNWEAYYLRGDIRLLEGQTDDALEDYAAAADLNGGDAALCLHICASLYDAGMEEEAQDYIDTAIGIEPSSAEEYYDLGRICYLTGDLGSAEDYLLKAQEMGEGEASLLLADLYADRGDEESASSLYAAYLNDHPDDAHTLARLGEISLDAGDYETAISYLRTARETAQGDALRAIVTDLVAAYEYSGDFESAWEVAAAYLADHTDEELEREYTFLSTRVGAAAVVDEQPAEEVDISSDEEDVYMEGENSESDGGEENWSSDEGGQE